MYKVVNQQPCKKYIIARNLEALFLHPQGQPLNDVLSLLWFSLNLSATTCILNKNNVLLSFFVSELCVNGIILYVSLAIYFLGHFNSSA